MASANFRSFILDLAQTYFAGKSFKALLVTSVPSESALDSWTTRSQVVGEHPATGGYTEGGFDVDLVGISLDTSNNRVAVEFGCDDPVYQVVSLDSVIGCLIYASTGNAANDRLISFVDFGAPKSVAGGAFRVIFTSPLFLTLTA